MALSLLRRDIPTTHSIVHRWRCKGVMFRTNHITTYHREQIAYFTNQIKDYQDKLTKTFIASCTTAHRTVANCCAIAAARGRGQYLPDSDPNSDGLGQLVIITINDDKSVVALFSSDVRSSPRWKTQQANVHRYKHHGKWKESACSHSCRLSTESCKREAACRAAVQGGSESS